MDKLKDQDQLLSRKEAAKYLGNLNPGTLAVWASTKRYNLKFVKAGKSVRYRRSELDRFLEQS